MANLERRLEILDSLIFDLIKKEKFEDALAIIYKNLDNVDIQDNPAALSLIHKLAMRVNFLLEKYKAAYIHSTMLSMETKNMNHPESYFLASKRNELQFAVPRCGLRFANKIKEIQEISDMVPQAILGEESQTSVQKGKGKLNSKKKGKGKRNDGEKTEEQEIYREIQDKGEIKGEGEKDGEDKGEIKGEGEKDGEDQEEIKVKGEKDAEDQGEIKVQGGKDGEDEGEIKVQGEKDAEEKGKVDDDYPREISVPFTVKLLSQNRDGNYYGETSTDFITLKKSFVVASHIQAEYFSQLHSLCSSSRLLLTLENIVSDPVDNNRLLVCEYAISLDDFFEQENFSLSDSPLSLQTWWDHISNKFWHIFRDISRALLFLYKKNITCGKLSFSMFVTDEERGKILPSMETYSKKVTDVQDLVSKMMTTISFPCHQSSSPPLGSLPHELSHFYSFISSFLGLVPPSLLLVHPYFWSLGEKIAFIPKLGNLLRKGSSSFQRELRDLPGHPYEFWDKRLDGVYYQIWCKGNPAGQVVQLPLNAIWVQKYRKEVDIVRFFGAVYKHVNNEEYKAYRQKEEMTDGDIERELIKLFPNFYIDMFSCLCICVKKKEMNFDELKPVLSCFDRDEDEGLVSDD